MIAVVTGAASGIGRAVAAELLSRDHRVVAVVRPGSTASAGAEVQEADLSDLTAVEALADRICGEVPQVDLLVHAAGVAELAPLDGVTTEAVAAHLAVNLVAPIALILALRHHLARAGGAVVTFSSEQVRLPTSTNLAYGASKAGLEHATRSLAASLGPEGVRVCCLSLGGIDTPMLRRYLPDGVAPANVLGRRGSTADVVAAIDFLVANPHLTGAVIPLDGGAHLA